MNKNIKFLSLAILVIAIGGAYVFPKVQERFGADPGPVKTEAQEFQGGVSLGLTNSTSTTDTSYTMVAADLASSRQGAFFSTYIHQKTGSVATTTITFPASSTLAYVLPKAGMRTDICFLVATSTGGAGLTLAEGTGWKFVNASSSLTVTGGGVISNNGGVGRTIIGGQPTCGQIMREPLFVTTAGYISSTSTLPGDFVLTLVPTSPAQ